MNKLSWAASVGAGVCLVVLAQWVTRPAEPVASDTAAARPDASAPLSVASGQAQPAAGMAAPLGPAISTATPPPPTKSTGLIPKGMGSEGLGPHIRRDIELGTAEALDRSLRRMLLCAKPEILNNTSDQLRTEQWGGPAATKIVLEGIAAFGRACQTVTPDILAQRPAIAERLVVLKWPGAVREYEFTLDRSNGFSYSEAMQQRLASWHREAALRGDEQSLNALAARGSVYGIDSTERRAWGHLVQRCYPTGLRTRLSGDEREAFLFREQQPTEIKAYADRGLPVPPVDAKVDADARTLAASWPCPPPAK